MLRYVAQPQTVGQPGFAPVGGYGRLLSIQGTAPACLPHRGWYNLRFSDLFGILKREASQAACTISAPCPVDLAANSRFSLDGDLLSAARPTTRGLSLFKTFGQVSMSFDSSTSTMSRRQLLSASLAVAFASVASAQSATVLAEPGQPQRTGIPGGFEIIGESLVSAQMVSLLQTLFSEALLIRDFS